MSDYPTWKDYQSKPLTREQLEKAFDRWRERMKNPPPRVILEHPDTIKRWLDEGLIRKVPGGGYAWVRQDE